MDQSRPGSNSNIGVTLPSPELQICGLTSGGSLVSYPEHSFDRGSYHSTGYAINIFLTRINFSGKVQNIRHSSEIET